jgi:hypothetical protein
MYRYLPIASKKGKDNFLKQVRLCLSSKPDTGKHQELVPLLGVSCGIFARMTYCIDKKQNGGSILLLRKAKNSRLHPQSLNGTSCYRSSID